MHSQESLYIQPKQCTFLGGKFPQNYRTFAVFDPPQMSNWMTPDSGKLAQLAGKSPLIVGNTPSFIQSIFGFVVQRMIPQSIVTHDVLYDIYACSVSDTIFRVHNLVISIYKQNIEKQWGKRLDMLNYSANPHPHIRWAMKKTCCLGCIGGLYYPLL